MSDHSELKKLAEACGTLNWRFQQEHWTEYAIRDDHGYIATMRVASPKQSGPDPEREAKAKFLGAMTPETVLALIAEVERLRTAEGDAMTYKAGMENVAQQRDQLKAEIASLTKEADQLHHECARFRKNSERYCWLRDMHIGDDPESINLDSAIKNGLDAAIDAAMSKEVQS